MPDGQTVRGRLAPSPTGRLHLGNAFAFLCAWLSARAQGGSVVLRMEDIDLERSRPEYADAIMEDLAWLGIDWDEGPDKGGPHGPYTQSARMDLYKDALDALAGNGLVYPCYCTRKELRMLASAPHIGDEGVPYPGTCKRLRDNGSQPAPERSPSLRLDAEKSFSLLANNAAQTPPKELQSCSVCFTDRILGPQDISLARIGGDFPLRRSDGVIAYQLAVAVDDAAMQITEVVRGNDLLLSTPRQILLHRLLGVRPLSYAHIPLLLDAQGERLAKRHKALQLAQLREMGIPPENIIGFLAFLAGWSTEPPAKRAHAFPASPSALIGNFSVATLPRTAPTGLPLAGLAEPVTMPTPPGSAAAKMPLPAGAARQEDLTKPAELTVPEDIVAILSAM